jgi:hypothetical protein
LRIIEGIKGDEAAKHQAEALGWLAVVVAKRDPKRAFALIDRALTVTLDRERSLNLHIVFGGAAGTAARIAFCARRVGYPDMDSVIARVLAARPAPDRYYSTLDVGARNDPAPALLALTAPAAAGELLRQIAAGRGTLPNPGARVDEDRWLIAWGLPDPKHAQTLVESALVSIDESKGTAC